MSTPKISYEDFSKVEIRVGKILTAEKVADADKLLRLTVDFGKMTEPLAVISAKGEAAEKSGIMPGEPVAEIQMTEMKHDVRQIVSGIAAYFPDPQVLVGRKCMFVTNLEPRKIRGLESDGMLFAVSTSEGKFSLLEPGAEIPEGTKAK